MQKMKILSIIIFFLIIGTVRAACSLDIEIKDSETFIDDYLNFNLHIRSYENLSKHIRLDYLLIDGKNWTYPSEDVLLEGNSNKTIEKHFYIYPIFDAGEYRIVISTICGFDEVRQEKTFTIKDKGQLVKRNDNLKVTDEIDIVRGERKTFNAVLKNEKELHNIQLKIESISSEWFTIAPKKILILNGDGNFSIEIAVPETVKTGEYPVKIISTSDESESEVMTKLFIFSEEKALVNHMIERLKKEINDMVELTKEMHNEALNNALNSADSSIEISESAFNDGNYGEARRAAENAEVFLQNADTILSSSQTAVEKTADITIYILISVAAVIAVIVVFRKYHIKIQMPAMKFPHPSLHIPRLSKAIEENVKKAPIKEINPDLRKSLENEKKRVVNLLLIIKKEYKERTITKATYIELKKENEKRLKEIDDKLDEL